MDEKPDQIIEHIEARRDELGRNLSELETKVRRTTDWHTYYDKNPMMILGAALGGGLLVGAVIGGRSSRPRTRGIKTSYRSSTGTLGTGRTGSSSPSSYYTPAESGPSSYSGLGTSTGVASQHNPASSNISGSSSTSGSSAGTTASTASGASSAGVASTVSNLTNKLQTLAGGQLHQVNEAVDHIRGALIAFGITKVKEFLSQSVPGLEQHLAQLGGNQHSGSTGSSYTTGSSSQTPTGASDYRSGSQNYSGGSSSYGTGSSGQTGNAGQSAQPGNTGPSATNTGRASEADEYAGAGTRGSNPRP